jgi:hypothetical protein
MRMSSRVKRGIQVPLAAGKNPRFLAALGMTRVRGECRRYSWNFGGTGLYPGGVPFVMKGKSSGCSTSTRPSESSL